MRQVMSFLRGALATTLVTALVTTLGSVVLATATTAPAQAAPAAVGTTSVVDADTSAKADTTKAKKKAKRRTPLRRRALAKARTRAGKPYQYGASGPHAFDCSGLTRWAYAKVGKKLPRTSRDQAAKARRITHPKRGDLVFFHNGGTVYHVGLYAGKGRVFHASRPGTPVGQAKIWTSSVFYGRV